MVRTGGDPCLPDGADPMDLCETEAVRPGDGWISIAQRVGTSPAALGEVNGGGTSRVLHPGDELCLPAGSRSGGSSQSSRDATSYTVRPGDSWFGLASRMGVGAGALLAANSASADQTLLVGRVLELPAGATVPERTSAPSAGWLELDGAPVQGPCGYADTWLDARGGGRRHLGVDLFTGPRAYVYAVADGTLTGRRWAGAGAASGNAWTLTTSDGSRIFYAHLSDFNPDLAVGSTVEAGEILGWVGATGNASAAHLHLEMRPQGGGAVNPYPVLRAQGGCNDGRPYQQPSGWWPG